MTAVLIAPLGSSQSENPLEDGLAVDACQVSFLNPTATCARASGSASPRADDLCPSAMLGLSEDTCYVVSASGSHGKGLAVTFATGSLYVSGGRVDFGGQPADVCTMGTVESSCHTNAPNALVVYHVGGGAPCAEAGAKTAGAGAPSKHTYIISCY